MFCILNLFFATTAIFNPPAFSRIRTGLPHSILGLRSVLVNDSNRSLRLAPKEGVPKISAIHIHATNSCTDIPAARINARSVPGATTRCWGTDRLAACPGLMRMTWLPRWRSLLHPAF
jgi:hypothetical protein